MILIDGKKEAALLREELKKEVSSLKTKYNKTYFQIIPFYLLQFINVQDFKFDTKIGEKIKELLINPDFKEKCIQLYQIYNQNQNYPKNFLTFHYYVHQNY